MEKTANCESKQTAATPAIANDVASRMSGAKLVKDGAGLTACTFIAALGNYGFQCVLGRHLPLAEYGLANAAFGAVFLLTLPVLAASSALIHYIARFRARGQEAHLRGLLAGARSGLLVLGVSGLLFTLVLVKPLTSFCDFPRSSLVIGIAIGAVGNLAMVFVLALCTGMGWYWRAGLLTASAALAKPAIAWLVTLKFASAEGAVAALFLSMSVFVFGAPWRANLIGNAERINPFNRGFASFALAAISVAIGSYGFTQSDVLIAQRNLSPEAVAQFCGAGVFARALLGFAGPLLSVFFSSRSAGNGANGRAHAWLLALYVIVMLSGATAICVFNRPLTVSLFGREEPAAAALMGKFAMLMVMIGLIEVLANRALARRQFALVYLHVTLAVLYVASGFFAGTSTQGLLFVLSCGAAAAVLTLGFFSFRMESVADAETILPSDPASSALSL